MQALGGPEMLSEIDAYPNRRPLEEIRSRIPGISNTARFLMHLRRRRDTESM